MTVVAVVPIKHHSSRVPGKNYKCCNGRPLFTYILRTLVSTPEITRVIVDTDSDTIEAGVREHFGDTIDVYRRPSSLCGDDVSTNLLLENVIDALNLKAEYFVHTHVTNPLLKSETISRAIATLRANPDKDSLFGVKTHHTRFYTHDGKDLNHDRFHLIPTQNLDPIYEENSCVYVFPAETLHKYHARIGKDAMLFPMTDVESTDIDWPEDFERAVYLLQQ